MVSDRESVASVGLTQDRQKYGSAAYGTTTPQNDTTNKKKSGTKIDASNSFGENEAMA